ncbi:MAG: DUF5687 family protein [Prevotellaceae bacterium]|nr:DUF5687 family protein [Prevotellaceae bacterium]
MNKLQLLLMLRRNMKLSNRRHPMFEQNKVAILFAAIGIGFMSIYFIALGTMLGWGARGGDEGLIFAVWPMFLIMDFFMRFGGQQLPSLMIKPYLLMPVRKHDITDCFIILAMCSSFNLLWLLVLVPYFFIVFCGGLTFGTTIAMLLVCEWLVIINALWSMLVRTLYNQSIWWVLLPIAVYAIPFSPMLFLGAEKGFEAIIEFCYDNGFTLPAILIYAVVTVALFVINSRLQARLATKEVAAEEKEVLTNTSQMSFLNRYGLTGEYLKLEIKSAIRNKALRQRYIQGLFLITLLSLMLAYTDIYSSKFAVNMWCLYCFVFFGAVNLVKIMGPEGNYIDLLMTHKENIYEILKAKYYFFCAVLILPTLLLLPPVFSGRFSVLMVLAYLFITMGAEHCLLFQLAVYNKGSLPLNEKITSKGNFENKLQIIIELIVFFIPVLLAVTLTTIFGDTVGYLIVIAIGLGFTVTHPLWLRNIYNRFMERRYTNIEGFHATR